MTTVPGIAVKRVRRRPYEYDHHYGVRVEAPTKASRRAASPDGKSRRRAQAAYRSRAVRALVLLHDEHLRRFLVVWSQARAASVVLPKTDDPDYASLETLLHHVLGAARGYMTWMCEVLELPDPRIRIPPEPSGPPSRSRQLHGARAGAMAHAAAGRRR